MFDTRGDADVLILAPRPASRCKTENKIKKRFGQRWRDIYFFISCAYYFAFVKSTLTTKSRRGGMLPS